MLCQLSSKTAYIAPGLVRPAIILEGKLFEWRFASGTGGLVEQPFPNQGVLVLTVSDHAPKRIARMLSEIGSIGGLACPDERLID